MIRLAGSFSDTNKIRRQILRRSKLFDAMTLLVDFFHPRHFSYQFQPSGFGFVSASEDKTARLFDLRSDQEVFVYRPPTANSGLTSCGLSPSGRVLLAGSDDSTVHLWDVIKGEHNGTTPSGSKNLQFSLATHSVLTSL